MSRARYASPRRSWGESRVGACAAAVLSLWMAAACDTTLDPFDIDRGLIGHWTFDEPSADGTVVDSSGHDHHGTPSASPPTPSLSLPSTKIANGRSLHFDGVAQFVDLGNPPGLQISGRITLAAWINPTVTDGLHYVVAHGYRFGPDQEIALRIRDAMYQMMTWDGSQRIAEFAIPLGDVGNWVHLCGVYDGTSYILYRNGARVGALVDPVAPTTVDAPWGIGGRPEPDPPGDLRSFGGLLDDVRVYARALSAGEVAALADR